MKVGHNMCGALSERDLDEARRKQLIAAIRCASIQMLLSKNQLDSVGVALSGGLIDRNQALSWLEEQGALILIDTIEERNGV